MTDRINSLASDTSLSIDDRIEAMMTLREKTDGWGFRQDIKAFESLIRAIRDEKEIESHALDLLQLYALLAETYEDNDIYRPLERLSFEVRGLVWGKLIAWDDLKTTLPRIIDAVSESVYHHETYMLLLAYLHRAYTAGKLDASLKEEVSHLLKLQVLLEDPDRSGHVLDKGMQNAIASLFTPDELMRIIIDPSIGCLKVDPVEYTRRWEEIYYDVEERLNRRFAGERRHMGFCFMFWSAKQDLLKEVYGIEWHTPSQMNPRVMFD